MALTAPGTLYRVTIRYNLVTRVDAIPSAAADGLRVLGDPLEASTIAAQHMLREGCLDGDYCFPDLAMARHFASLAMDVVAKIVTKTHGAVDTADIYPNGWHNPWLPAAKAGRGGN